MTEHAGWIAGSAIDVDRELEREFEARLLESSTLAFRLAYSVLRHQQDAEDVAQEAFARAHRRFGQLRDRSRFRAWLARMTWRLALDRQRANRRRLVRESAVVPLAAAMTSAPVDLVASDRAKALWHAIDALPEKLRLTVVLVNLEEHDLASVAALLEVPEGTVKWRLFEARRRLRDALSWMKNDY
jgi:RNA polymerase sigma-70 factor, ECF subfamily